MNVSSEPAKTPGSASGQRDPPEGGRPVRVQVLGGLDEPVVDLLERHVERQDHERQEVVGDPGDLGDGRAQEAERARQDPQRVLQRPEDRALVTQQDLPADRADQEAGEERRDDEEQDQVLVAAAPERDRVGDREPDEQAQDRRDPAVEDRVEELLPEGLEPLAIGVERPGDREPFLDGARRDRVREHLDRRDDEEEDQEQQARRQQDVGQRPCPRGRASRGRSAPSCWWRRSSGQRASLMCRTGSRRGR